MEYVQSHKRFEGKVRHIGNVTLVGESPLYRVCIIATRSYILLRHTEINK